MLYFGLGHVADLINNSTPGTSTWTKLGVQRYVDVL